MSHGEMPSIIRKLRRAGVRVEQTRRHYKVYCPAGIVVMSATPSDHRARKNMKTLFKRYGLAVQGVL